MSWEVSLVKCDVCKHIWTAVRPEGTPTLECPNCNHNGNFDSMMIEKETTKTDIWIDFEHATFRVWIKDADKLPIEQMNESDTKPDFINDVSLSSDPARNKDSFLISVSGNYNLTKVKHWIREFIT